MISEALHLSVELDRLERKIKNTNTTELVTYPSDGALVTKRLIEYAKPNQLIRDMTNRTELGQSHIECFHAPAELRVSFQEVLGLAKSGQQPWWTDKTKKSTDAHIQRVCEFYEKYIKK
tara:strand:- start:713 stop:1069 length:357 start_codon:yes stop_codon:yes gene_type:complete